MLVAFGGCGDDDGGSGSDGYPAAVKKNYIDACKKQGSDAKMCDCTFAKVQERFSYEEFKKEDTAIAAGGKPSRKLTDALAECRE